LHERIRSEPEVQKGILFLTRVNMQSTKNFLSRFREYSRKYNLLQKGDTVLLGVSGGMDSMVLLDVLARHTPGVTIEVAHVNHTLRGEESEADEELVRSKAESYELRFHRNRVATETLATEERTSIQEAARKIRYQFFESVRQEIGFDRIATAHHADDSAETILFNLFRGTGPAGLTGIHPERAGSHIIRPLLFAERGEIEEYAHMEAIEFRTDSSNIEEHYTRNFIRRQILPRIKEEINPGVAQTLMRSGELFRELASYVDMKAQLELAKVVVGGGEGVVTVSIPALREHHNALRRVILHKVGSMLRQEGLDFEHVDALLQLMGQQTGSRIELPGGLEAMRDRDHLVFKKEEQAAPFALPVELNKEYHVRGWKFSSAAEAGTIDSFSTTGAEEFVDAECLKDKQLILRSWSDGDVFVPLGMKEKKKVSDFLINEKVPLFEKHNFPILETTEGDVVWLCGQRIDDRFKITRRTKQVLRLEYSREIVTSGKNPSR